MVELQIAWYYTRSHSFEIHYFPILEDDEYQRQLGGRLVRQRDEIPKERRTNLDTVLAELLQIIHTPSEIHTGLVEELRPQIEWNKIRRYATPSFRGITPDKPLDTVIIMNWSARTNLTSKGVNTVPRIEELSSATQAAIRELDRYSRAESFKDYVKKIMVNTHSERLRQYLPDKQKVFISYRRRVRDFSLRLHKSVADYAYSSLFEPFVDVINLKPGDWRRQLEENLTKSHCFVPVLTPDYFDGPVSKGELGQAIERSSIDDRIAVIPALLEGDYDDYGDSPLGRLQMVDFTDDKFYQEKIDVLVDLLLKEPA